MGMSLNDLDARYVGKDICGETRQRVEKIAESVDDYTKELNKTKLETLQTLAEIKQNVISLSSDVKHHNESHESAFSRKHLTAIVFSTVIAALALLVSAMAMMKTITR